LYEADRKDAGHVGRRQDTLFALIKQAIEAVLESHNLGADACSGCDDGADHGIEAWRVASIRQDADSSACLHRCLRSVNAFSSCKRLHKRHGEV
jgi:hypothetical protein